MALRLALEELDYETHEVLHGRLLFDNITIINYEFQRIENLKHLLNIIKTLNDITLVKVAVTIYDISSEPLISEYIEQMHIDYHQLIKQIPVDDIDHYDLSKHEFILTNGARARITCFGTIEMDWVQQYSYSAVEYHTTLWGDYAKWKHLIQQERDIQAELSNLSRYKYPY